MAEQLIKKTEEGYSNVMPKSWIEAITDKSTGESLVHILQGFNMYFLSYTGNTEQTRCQVPKILRKKGLWVTYVKYDGNVYTEWYNSNNIDDKSWGNSSNWRVGNNELVGDLTISANGNWVINGNETEFKAIGEKGNTPLIRIANNKLQVSYDTGDTYHNVDDNPVYTQIRTYNNKLQISTDLGANWTDASDEIAAYFRFNSGQGNNVGNIQISRNNKDWSDLSGNFVNNLHISKYIGAGEALPTSGIAEGTIYAKGPTYADSDTSHSNPIYRLWVYAYKGNTLAWQDNGEFTSISAGVVQEVGNSTAQVMSQDSVTREFAKLSEKIDLIQPVIDTITSVSPNLFDVAFAGRAYIDLSGGNVGKVHLDGNDNYAATPDAIGVKANTLYSFFCNNPFPYEIGAFVVFYDANEGYLSNVTYSFNTSSHTLFQFTTPSGCAYVRFQLRVTGKGNELAQITQWQLNEGAKKDYQEAGIAVKIDENFVSVYNNAAPQKMNPCLTNNVVKSYIDNVDYTGQDYTQSQIKQYENVIGFYDFDKPFGVLVKWTPMENIIQQTILLSLVSTQVANADALRFNVPIGVSKLCIKNLLPNKTYYYKVMVVTDEGEEKQVKLSRFTTSADRLRMLDIDGVRNVRDIGGWRTTDGKQLKYGILVRGGELSDTSTGYLISDKGRYDLLKIVGVRCDLDLRGGTRDSSELGNSVIYSNVEFQPYKNALTNGATATVSTFQFIAEQLGYNRTIYFHCQGGQDRTGTLALLIEGLCGVSESDLSKDYELTEFAHPTLGSGTPSATRTRTQFVELIDYIKTFNGVSLQEKIYNALVSIGVSAENLDTIKAAMVV